MTNYAHTLMELEEKERIMSVELAKLHEAIVRCRNAQSNRENFMQTPLHINGKEVTVEQKIAYPRSR